MTLSTEFALLIAEVKEAMGPITKDAENPHFKHNYATLGKVLTVVEPELSKHGLFLIQPCVVRDGENVVQTVIVNSNTGEDLTSEFKLTSSPDPQKQASALTYARRYQILSLLGLVTEDDDGNEGARRDNRPPAAQPRATTDQSVEDKWLEKLSAATTQEQAKAVGNEAWSAQQLTDNLRDKVAERVAELGAST